MAPVTSLKGLKAVILREVLPFGVNLTLADVTYSSNMTAYTSFLAVVNIC
jgi:hypothetical protein